MRSLKNYKLEAEKSEKFGVLFEKSSFEKSFKSRENSNKTLDCAFKITMNTMYKTASWRIFLKLKKILKAFFSKNNPVSHKTHFF